ncbi:MAG: CDP-alcohol phosphatidyltransferase family protein [Candidatus Methylomirabilales bacterium]
MDSSSRAVTADCSSMMGMGNVESVGVTTASHNAQERTTATGVLFIAPSSGEHTQISPRTILLGLPLLRRSVLAASRAGFERIVVQTAEPAGMRRLLHGVSATVLSPGETIDPLPPGRIVLLAANILGQPDWFRRLLDMPIEPGMLYRDADGVAVIDAVDSHAISSIVSRGLPASDLFAALGQSFNTVDRRLGQHGMLALTRPRDVAQAEDWLLRSLVKETEGFMSRHFERWISLAISRRLVSTRITPNTMTAVSIGIGLVGAPFFLSSIPAYQLTGALLFLAHSILDGCDGELARLKFQESRWGGLIDFWGDNVVHVAVFSCMAVGWSLAIQAPWPLLLGAMAVAGTVGSAWFAYWHTMREKRSDGPLFTSIVGSPGPGVSRLLDALANRDFIYGIVLLSAFGKAAWFLVLTAIGAPVFFLLLLWTARNNLSKEERLS